MSVSAGTAYSSCHGTAATGTGNLPIKICATSAALLSVRSTTAIAPAFAAANSQAVARAMRPAPRITIFLPAGSSTDRKPPSTPLPSVLSPTSSSPSRKKTFTAPTAAAISVVRSSSADDRLFVRRIAMPTAKSQRLEALDGVEQIFRTDLEGQIPPIEIVMREGLLDHVLPRTARRRISQQSQDRLHGSAGHGTPLRVDSGQWIVSSGEIY